MKILDAILSFSLIALCCIFGYFVHQTSQQFMSMQDAITQIQDQSAASNYMQSVQMMPQKDTHINSDACSTALSSQLWSKLQKGLQDTVVQILVTNIEKNVLQPYKVPKQGGCTGSGFIISSDGEIITNAHVVNGATTIMVQMPSFGKHQFEVDLIGIMPEKDLALLKFRLDDIKLIISTLGKMPMLPLGDSDLVTRSQEILALGYPLGQQSLKSTTGVISGREAGEIQMSAPINPGSSGGPSLNCFGEVIGINSSGIVQAQNVGYIIPINDLKIFLKHLRAGGLVRKPYLGVYQAMATQDLVKALGNPLPGGTYVVEVLSDSPLLGKLQPGDMIYDINGVPLDLYGEMTVPWSEDKISSANYISRLEVGQKVAMTVYRKGKKMKFECAFERTKFAPIRHVFAEYEELPYEVFGGFVVMPLMVNHLPHLIPVAPGLAKFAEEKKQSEPLLVITHVMPDSPAFKARLRLVGSLIKTINGKPVYTLADLHKALVDSGDMITMETTDNILAALTKENICKAEPILARANGYQITPMMQELLAQQEQKVVKVPAVAAPGVK